MADFTSQLREALSSSEGAKAEALVSALDADTPVTVDAALLELCLDKLPAIAATLLARPNTNTSPSSLALAELPQCRKTALERALERGSHEIARHLVSRSDNVSGETSLGLNKTAFEVAINFASEATALALVKKEGFDPLFRVSDGRTLMEKALDDTADKAAGIRLVSDMLSVCKVPAMAYLSNGKTVFERVLKSRDQALAQAMLSAGTVKGSDRLPDGDTVFEWALDAGAHGVAEVLVMQALTMDDNVVAPDWVVSTGVTAFERALAAGAKDVAKRLAGHKEFDAQARVGDGRTFYEVAFDSGAGGREVAMAILASGKISPRALLSDARTPFERALRAGGGKEVAYVALTAGGLTPMTTLPPHEKTCFEVALDCPGAADVAVVMVKFMGLDGMHVLGDGRTCFERAIETPNGGQSVAVAFVEAGSVGPASRLPDGKSCIDYAISKNAREVAQAIAKKI